MKIIFLLSLILSLSSEEYWLSVNAKVTAYTAWDPIDANSGYQDGYTSIGINTQLTNEPNKIYGIAADPRILPYHTEVYVPKYWDMLQNNKVSRPTRVIVDDTGYNMRRSWDNGIIHIDVRFRNRETAINWGVKYTRIYIKFNSIEETNNWIHNRYRSSSR